MTAICRLPAADGSLSRQITHRALFAFHRVNQVPHTHHLLEHRQRLGHLNANWMRRTTGVLIKT
ncbi:hypothetical protein ACLK19_29180 [Escherichia coli]